MLGWKITRADDSGNFLSLRARVPGYVRNYRIGLTITEMEAPMFFFSDDLTAEDLIVWGVHQSIEVALLRVEASEPARAITRCADKESDFSAFWEIILANGEWPPEKSFGCPAKTLISTSITPLAFVWQGRKTDDIPSLTEEIRAAMATVRQPITDDVNVFLPVINR